MYKLVIYFVSEVVEDNEKYLSNPIFVIFALIVCLPKDKYKGGLIIASGLNVILLQYKLNSKSVNIIPKLLRFYF